MLLRIDDVGFIVFTNVWSVLVCNTFVMRFSDLLTFIVRAVEAFESEYFKV